MKKRSMLLQNLVLSSMFLACIHGCGISPETNQDAQKDSNLSSSWLGIWAETDNDTYTAGTEGYTTLTNGSMFRAYLPGCGNFNYEKLVDGKWVNEGPDIICIWEGLVRPINPYESITFEFMNRYIGTWRLRYTLSFGCIDEKPMSQADCILTREFLTNEFTVTPGLAEDCIDSGGTVDTANCCQSADDFPNSCLIGACGCAPEYSHEVKVCNCPEDMCFDGHKCI